MKKIYASFKTLVYALALSSLTSSAFGQASICGNIAQDFNNTSGGTGGFTGSFSFAGATGAGYLQKSNVIANGQYTVTTPTFQIPATTTFIGYGFLLGGTERVARVEASIIYRSTLNNEITTVFLSQFVPTYDPTTPPTADVCNAIATANLAGFPAGGQYRIQFVLTPNTGFGQASSTITVDDYKTNGVPSPSPLPVSFIGFEAKRMAAGNQLTWKVAGEENVSRYEVERSTDGRSYATVATAGVTKKDTYTYLDAGANTTAYYRIKNVDNDGKFKYSNIARIANGGYSIVITAFPQPAVGQLTVQHPVVRAAALITLSTADGRVVNNVRPLAGSMQTYIDMTKLQKGLYVVRFTDGEGATETMKVVKQ